MVSNKLWPFFQLASVISGLICLALNSCQHLLLSQLNIALGSILVIL